MHYRTLNQREKGKEGETQQKQQQTTPTPNYHALKSLSPGGLLGPSAMLLEVGTRKKKEGLNVKAFFHAHGVVYYAGTFFFFW